MPIHPLSKSPTGINGLDQVTNGGLPKSRTTLVCGGPGCGKSLLSMEFIVKGALEHGEPGVFVTFEETAPEITENYSSLGIDIPKMTRNKLLRIDHVEIDAKEISETGDYDLDGLFIRLEYAIKSIGAKRVVLDTIENLFAGLSNQGTLRAELRRLFHWLKDQGVTSIVTAEQGEGTLTRHGLEEYVSDCVILLDHRVIQQVSTRRLRVVKYRGSLHGTNEYPFLIDEEGITVMPVTSLLLDKTAPTKRISSGLPVLDKMLGGKGFYRSSSILVSGSAGTGKTSVAASFVDAACKRGERCIFFAFEESPRQTIRNMRSIGIDLEKHLKKGLLKFNASRPTIYGLEMHLVSIYKMVQKEKPDVVVIDPISNLNIVGEITEIKSMIIRLVDFLQTQGVTVLFTFLTTDSIMSHSPAEYVASIVDSWLIIKDYESENERSLNLRIVKSSGIKTINHVMNFKITDKGLQLNV